MKNYKDLGCSRQNNGYPKMSMPSSLVSVNMLPYIAKGTLQLSLN